MEWSISVGSARYRGFVHFVGCAAERPVRHESNLCRSYRVVNKNKVSNKDIILLNLIESVFS